MHHKASICLDDLFAASKAGHSAITTAKNGKKYANVVIWINEKEDQYGKIGSIQLSQPKDSQQQKVFIGNVSALKKAESGQVDILNDLDLTPF
jgi:hypothetical protein